MYWRVSVSCILNFAKSEANRNYWFSWFFSKNSVRAKIGKDKVRIVWITWRSLVLFEFSFLRKKNLVNMLNYVFHGWVDGRCMYFSIFWTTEGDMLLWTTNPVAACKDTFSIFSINLFVKIRLSAASNSSGFHSKKKAHLASLNLFVQFKNARRWLPRCHAQARPHT